MYNEILDELGDLATVVSRNYVYGKIKDRTGLSIRRQYFNNNRKEKLGRPNYKNKHDNQSFRLPFPKFKITDNKIRIEKIGWVKIVIDREIPDNARFISCAVSKNRSGQYFVSVLAEQPGCRLC